MQHDGGTVLCLQNRQKIEVFKGTSMDGGLKGGYIVSTGSEVCLCVQAVALLKEKKINVRIVSAPCLELFDKQSTEYKKFILFGGLTGGTVVIIAG